MAPSCYFDLAAGEPVAFRMRVACSDSAIELGRSRHLLPEVFEDRMKRRIEVGVGGASIPGL